MLVLEELTKIYNSFRLRGRDRKEMVNQEMKEWNRMEMNEFYFIVIWIAKDGREQNENKSCLDRKNKIKEKNVI